MRAPTLVEILTTLGVLQCCPTMALSVIISGLPYDVCEGYTGHLSAYAAGGMEPYSYEWFYLSGNNWVSMQVYSPEIENLGTGFQGGILYRVVVTDALGDTGFGEQYVVDTEFYIYQMQVVGGYVEGEQAMIRISVGDGDEVQYCYINGQPQEFYQNFTSVYALVPLGSTEVEVEVWGTVYGYECPGASAEMTLPTPTVLPEMTVVDVNGSCSNANTGSVTVLLGEGNIPSGAGIRLKPNGSPAMTQTVSSVPGSHTFYNVPPGTHRLIISADALFNQQAINYGYSAMDTIFVTVPDLGATCGVVTGTAFVDHNTNCTKQTNEPGIPNAIVKVEPGEYYATTLANGVYNLALPVGSYTMELLSDELEEHCNGAPIPFTITGAAQGVAVNLASVSLVPLDVQLSLGSAIARPGFEFTYGLKVKNLTPAASGAISVTMEFDPILEYLSASPAPSSVNGNTITWTQASLSAWQQQNFSITFEVPADVGLLGTDLITSASITTANTDGNLDNNTATNTRTITGSYDPNDKLAFTSSGSDSYFRPSIDEWIDYTIRFQNTGTDTAFNVIITDTLVSDLDPGSIEIGAGSHPFSWQLRDQGTLKFYFLNIQLPDSNVNEPDSHGFVSFRIKSRDPQDLQPGDQIMNEANIFFDFNPPVITEPSILTVPHEVWLDAKVFLGGGFASGMNSDQLRAQGSIPSIEPYTVLGYDQLGEGGEQVHPSLFAGTGPDAIADWVLIEARSPISPSDVIASRSALLQRDGDVVDLDGISAVGLQVPIGNYHIAIRHRNHLGVMTAAPIALSGTPTPIDFTDPATPTWGTNPRKNVSGTMVLWPGDVNFNGSVGYTGASNDRDPILQSIGGTIATNTLTGVYSGSDVNLDGVVRYTGANNDRDIILQTIGGVLPTAVKVEQVP